MASPTITIDVGRHETFVDKKRVRPTLTEFRLLLALKNAGGNILTRGQLTEVLWTEKKRPNDPRTVDQHIARLRKCVGSGVIETVAGLGYKFVGA